MKRKLVLENGRVFYGKGFGSFDTKIAEIIFNTSMVGYQEMMSDASYCEQIVLMTYPLIGNYGVCDEDNESRYTYISGLIVREYNDEPSNFRATDSLGTEMKEKNVVGLCNVDTRAITRIIRDQGSMKGMICDMDFDDKKALKLIKDYKVSKTMIAKVSTKKTWIVRIQNPLFTIVALDCGMRLSSVKKLTNHKCTVVVMPHNSTKEEILKYKPDGLFISDGPGDPVDNIDIISLISSFKGELPIFGIGIGFLLIALSYGAKTYKMVNGHHGVNYPVLCIEDMKIEITSQNHSYAIVDESIDKTGLDITHVNLINNEIEGFVDKELNILAVHFHPNSYEKTDDDIKIYKNYIRLVEKVKGVKNAKKKRY